MSLLLSSNSKIINFSRLNENLNITPHMAGLTYESEHKALTKIFNCLKKML